MNNCFAFLKKNGNKTFEELPFCEADIIVISLLSYANFENSKYTPKDINSKFVNIVIYNNEDTFKKITSHFLVPKEYLKFIKWFFLCSRYKDLELGYFKNVLNEKIEAQFFGLTIKIDNKYFVLFRGTDRSLCGWKEDFNLALIEKSPSQEYAREYLEKMINLLGNNVTIIGHSKGGNLAYYAFYFVDDKIKEKVDKVYNLDGPGFKFDTGDLYKKHYEKLIKIVPENDVVGIILDDPSKLDICYSYRFDINAHDMLTWKFDNKCNFTKLKRGGDLTYYSKALRYALSNFMKEIGEDKIEAIKDAVFQIININKVSDILDVMNAPYKLFLREILVYLKKNKNAKDEATIYIREFLRFYFRYFFDDRKFGYHNIKSLLNAIANVKKEKI